MQGPLMMRQAPGGILTGVRLAGSIQFNSKTLFKDGDPVSLKLIFPGATQTWKQIQQLFIYIYKTKQVHQTITGKHNLHFHTKHKHSYLTYTIYIQIMTHSIIKE